MQAAKRVKFQLLDKLSDKYQQGYTNNYLKTGIIFSVVQLVDNNCVSILSKHHVNSFKKGKFIMKDRCKKTKNIYNTSLVRNTEPLIPSSSQQQALGVIQDTKTR